MVDLKTDVDSDEQERIQRMLVHEKRFWREGTRVVAGVDEAGRGPLAGPVVAAAVVFREQPDIPMVDDSKRLSEDVRQYLYDIIIQEAQDYGIGVADVGEIDRLNILQASMVAMTRAIKSLRATPDHVLVDGNAFNSEDIPFTTLVKGDQLSYSIAAASIVAKVTRDRIMENYDKQFPQYGFAQHKGYATQAHLDAIEQFGLCSIHRRSFHPKRFMDTQLLLFEDE